MPVQPRGRGEHTTGSNPMKELDGSAPRARGTPLGIGQPPLEDRFSPAGAGNTIRTIYQSSGGKVQPRGRGEHHVTHVSRDDGVGSAPRARGTPDHQGRPGRPERFSPAGAGNTGSRPGSTAAATVQPRGRGEHDEALELWHRLNGSAPRARGTHPVMKRFDFLRRFSPAGAGNTRSLLGCRSAEAVQPRGRGEHRGQSRRHW